MRDPLSFAFELPTPVSKCLLVRCGGRAGKRGCDENVRCSGGSSTERSDGSGDGANER